MNQLPPGEEHDLDALYRQWSARESSRPSENVRRAVLRHAANLAAERVSPREPARSDRQYATSKSFHRRAGIYGGLAAATLAGFLIAPRFLTVPSTSPRTMSTATSPIAAPSPMSQAPPPVSQAPPTAQAEPKALPREMDHPPLLSRPAPARDASAGKSGATQAPRGALRADEGPSLASAAGAPARSAPSLQGLAADRASVPPAAPPSVQLKPQAPRNAIRMDSGAALRQAAESGDLARLNTLLEEQIDVNARDAGGRTALMLAVLHGRQSAVDALLAMGADPKAADSNGTTPLQAALAGEQPAIAAALRRAGAE